MQQLKRARKLASKKEWNKAKKEEDKIEGKQSTKKVRKTKI